MAEFATAGFFGKLPSRGDFVSRRLPQQFLGVWDAWLQKALATSQAELGSEWLETYLTSPVWCFALSAEICGETAYAGVMMPSVDRIGRYFPLVAAVPSLDIDSTLGTAYALDAWYTRAQSLLLEALDEPPLELDALDSGLARIAATPHDLIAEPAWPLSLGGPAEPACWHFTMPSGGELAAYRSAVLTHAAEQALGAYALWWTAGSERMSPSVLLTSGLPPPDAFAAMLDGRWSAHGWQSATLRARPSTERRLPTRTAAMTDAGKSRRVNEDTFAYRSEAGVWLVADGLGGHREGDVASRMVATAVDEFAADGRFDARVSRLVDGLRIVNRCLYALGGSVSEGETIASTVAALVLGDNAIACVWAGDSRRYRLRDGALEQLTHDHTSPDTFQAEPSAADERGHAITRAVGGEEQLETEIRYADARPGDRYLLCTDGVYSEVGADNIVQALTLHDPEYACDALKARVLDGAAPDNLTAVIVHFEGGADTLGTELDSSADN